MLLAESLASRLERRKKRTREKERRRGEEAADHLEGGASRTQTRSEEDPTMLSILTYQSSEIDWCEANFQHSAHVAEFYNTISNVTFFIVAPLMMYLMHPYARERTWAVHIFWPMLMVVGIFSAYYHMTLSYLGQLLDEIAILWILAVGYSIWFPQPHFPSFIKDRSQFASAVSVTACVSTLMSFAKPTVNAYVLNCVTFHIIYVLVLEMRKCSLPRIHRLAAMSVCWWLLAISCWLSDRLLCGFWRRINFCYLHSFWHVLISITVVHSITLFAYFDAVYEIPQCQPEIQYWPCNRWQIGLPYLAVRCDQKPKKSC